MRGRINGKITTYKRPQKNDTPTHVVLQKLNKTEHRNDTPPHVPYFLGKKLGIFYF